MRIGEICTRDVVFCNPQAEIKEIARLMREYHVGALVVVEERSGRRFPTGLITDRDLVVEVLAADAPLEALTAGDIRTAEVLSVGESEDVFDTLELMRRKGVRRMPVVDAHGALAGIVTLDDLLEILAEELQNMVKLISRERLHEAEQRPSLPPETVSPRH